MRSFLPILRAKTYFSKNAQNQRVKLIFAKWAKILLLTIFNLNVVNLVCFGLVEAFKSEIFIWTWISAQTSTLGVSFLWSASGPGILTTLDLEEDKTFQCDMRNKIVRWQPSWQRSGVVSQQRLRLRRLTLANRVPKLRFEPVSFSFACFYLMFNLR